MFQTGIDSDGSDDCQHHHGINRCNRKGEEFWGGGLVSTEINQNKDIEWKGGRNEFEIMNNSSRNNNDSSSGSGSGSTR